MSEFKFGDRVRVSLEGQVVFQSATYLTLQADGGGNHSIYMERDSAHVEKIEPPVEVFKPGDHLRRKGALRYEITLADNGYLLHYTSGSVDYVKYDGPEHRKFFNSENFEKVNLS